MAKSDEEPKVEPIKVPDAPQIEEVEPTDDPRGLDNPDDTPRPSPPPKDQQTEPAPDEPVEDPPVPDYVETEQE